MLLARPAAVPPARPCFLDVFTAPRGSRHFSCPPPGPLHALTAVAARMARILAAVDASPPTTRLGPPTTDFLKGLAPAVGLAPARLALRHADNWVGAAGRPGAGCQGGARTSSCNAQTPVRESGRLESALLKHAQCPASLASGTLPPTPTRIPHPPTPTLP